MSVLAKAGLYPWKSRAIAFAGACAVATIALLSTRWDAQPEKPAPDNAAPAVATMAATAPPVEMPPPLPGNDSSISTVARQLVLTGTLVAADPADSRAFIGTDPKNPQTYALHGLLVNGTRIQAIARDHVLLERHGRTARLEIGSTWSDMEPAARRLAEIPAAAPAPTFSSLEQPSASLTDGIGITPVFDANGALTGYRLRPGRHKEVFARWGLQPGDRLIAIEGAPLVDVDVAAYQLEMIGRGESLNVLIDRGGKSVPVTLDGALIAQAKARAIRSPEGMPAAPGS